MQSVRALKVQDSLSKKEAKADCPVCGAKECRFLDHFRPYSDVDWTFDIFSCITCGARFALRDPAIDYYDILHTTEGSSYSPHYEMAATVRGFLENRRLDACERYLKRAAQKYGEVIDFIKKKRKPLSILEIGSTTGFMTAFLRGRGHEAEGIDISQRAIRYAQSTFGPFFSDRPSKAHYDLIFHLGLIGCLDQPRAFLKETLTLLSEEGEMIFNAPNVKSAEELGELWVSTPPPDLVTLFHDGSFRAMVDEPFEVKVRKVDRWNEIVSKNTRTRWRLPYTHFPVSFVQQRSKGLNRMKPLVRRHLKTAWAGACRLIDLLGPLKRYESEYGLMVTIRRKRTL